jgi:hypothetical protein
MRARRLFRAASSGSARQLVWEFHPPRALGRFLSSRGTWQELASLPREFRYSDRTRAVIQGEAPPSRGWSVWNIEETNKEAGDISAGGNFCSLPLYFLFLRRERSACSG